MIAYKASDIKFSWDQNDIALGGAPAPIKCGFIKEGLELETNNDEDEDDDFDDDGYNEDGEGDNELNGSGENRKSVWTSSTEHIDDSGEIPEPEVEALQKMSKKKRKKRQADQYEYTPTKTRCPLLLVADYRFFQEMGGSNTKTTINYLVRHFIYPNH